MPVDETTGEIPRVPFAAFLQDHQAGRLHADLTARWAEVVDAVRTLGKPGKLVLEFEVKPATEGTHVGQVFVLDKVTAKPPLARRAPAIYFVDDDANLSREDPHQLTLGTLREVPKPDTDLKEAK
jgi:hypothetical protein